MSITPESLQLPVYKLTRAMIYNEFRFFHHLAGGRRNVGNLTKLYKFADEDQTKVEQVIDCVDRYAALEAEIERRRLAQARWNEYVGRGQLRCTLEQIAHGKPWQNSSHKRDG